MKLTKEIIMRLAGKAGACLAQDQYAQEVIAFWSNQFETFAALIEAELTGWQPIETAPKAGKRADGMPASAEERRLRRMLCAQRHGTAAYMDDGEASWGGDEFQRPTDYMRESLDQIEDAWLEAAMKHGYALATNI